MVYEAEVVSVDIRAQRAEVRFLGFGNTEVKRLEELFMSKGEERRMQQEETGTEEVDEDIDSLLIRNCPDLLRNFGGDNDLTLEDLTIEDGDNKKKKDKKDKKEKKKSKEEKKSKIKQESESEEDRKPPFSLPSLQPPAQGLPGMFPPSFSSFTPQFPPSPFSSFTPQFPSSLPPPPPPPLPSDPSSPLPPELHSLLVSWYLAGYHTGLYQGASQEKQRRKMKK